jgi:hypothetical protein
VTPGCAHLDQISISGLPATIAGCEDWSWCFVDEVAFVVDGGR